MDNGCDNFCKVREKFVLLTSNFLHERDPSVFFHYFCKNANIMIPFLIQFILWKFYSF